MCIRDRFSSRPLHSLSLEVGPLIQLGGLGNAVSSPIGVWGRAPAENEVGVFSLKISHLVATILIIFLPENQLIKFCAL